MRWLLAGLLFALAVTLAIATAAVRAENVRARHCIEMRYREVEYRQAEFQRLSLQRLDQGSPQRLAQLHWQWLRDEAGRRLEQLQ